MAGRKSEECNAALLVLNHISPRSELDLTTLVGEAYDASNRRSSVLGSFDFLEVVVPWMGFGTRIHDDSETAQNEGTRGVQEEESDVKRWLRGVFR